MSGERLLDGEAREAVRSRLDETLFVEAGAGTGKTTVLVDRIVELVTAEGPDLPVPMRSVAAITFTEKAAAELRNRVRERLEDRVRDESVDRVVRDRCGAALAELDDAAICTLHSFAQRILTAFPVEAGLPPRIEVHDEVSSLLSFDERWRRTRDELLDDPELEPALLVLLAAKARTDHLRRVSEFLDDNWDLLDRIDHPPALPSIDLGPWLADLAAVCGRGGDCLDSEDKLLARLADLEEYGARLRAAVDDAARVELLLGDDSLFRVKKVGRKTSWPDIDEVREPILRLGEQREAITTQVTDAALRQVAAFLARQTAEAAADRRKAGELEFHDLLVLARLLLREPAAGPEVRRRLRERYRRLLIDEFQDTDPIQVEIAALLAASDDDTDGRDWRGTPVTPGHLFFVGDPKQSIYRFRRADISTFLEARDHFTKQPLRLTSNFRSTETVLTWINHVFGRLIQPAERSQPEYFALEHQREAAPSGPGVMLLGVDELDKSLSADQVREAEAAGVANAVRAAIDDKWQVDAGKSEWRDARLGDICILLPARTSLYALERALDDAGIPYRAETSSLVYSTREIRDILMTLRAVDDPSDELALVSALRSPVFGCGDDDLFEFHAEHGGRWDIRRPLPESLPDHHPVADAIRFLAELHEQRTWVTPSALLEAVVRDRRVLEVGVDSGRFRDVARRVRFVIDQSRAFGDAAGGSLRDYLSWATLQGTEGARVVETVLPETDDDAVRIMTIHGAKGLQFPIVVFSGASTQAGGRPGAVEVLFPPDQPYQVKLTRQAQTDAFELHKAIDEQMGFAEKLRLLYVACTRARDHLVVSVHRTDHPRSEDRTRHTAAELLWSAAHDSGARTGQPAAAGLVAHAPIPAPPVIELDSWLDEHRLAFETGARRRFVSATALAQLVDDSAAADPGVLKEGRDLELPPWNKGRYGTAIGRAVHAVLQTVDLSTGGGLADLAAAQAAAEGVLGFESTIADLVQSALASPTVRAACASEYWRETYVAVPVEGLTLEGYVDLVYRSDAIVAAGAPQLFGDESLVVVDYKTDAIADDAMLAARLEHYRVQGAAYAIAVATATGIRVDRCVFVFLARDGVREVEIAGAELEAAITQVRTLMRRVHDDPPELGPVMLSEA
jgi:ATP-dependent exoDNAse (exonuclease V) beta subunit